MRPLLLDTNVISELRKGKGRIDANVYQWAQKLDIESCYLSVITLFELERGILLLEKRDARQAAGLSRWLEEIREREFKGRILPLDVNVAGKAALIQVTNQKSLPDAFVAATALEHNLIVATRNTRDFLQSKVSVVNPWEPGAPILEML